MVGSWNEGEVKILVPTTLGSNPSSTTGSVTLSKSLTLSDPQFLPSVKWEESQEPAPRVWWLRLHLHYVFLPKSTEGQENGGAEPDLQRGASEGSRRRARKSLLSHPSAGRCVQRRLAPHSRHGSQGWTSSWLRVERDEVLPWCLLPGVWHRYQPLPCRWACVECVGSEDTA